jgi:predicted RNase H-like nuclease (RuvC/YqgF family)
MIATTETATNVIHVSFTATREAASHQSRERSAAEVAVLPKREQQPDPVFEGLRRAMDSLDANLDRQRREVKKFQASTRRLKRVMDEMKRSFQDFDASLSRINIIGVHRKTLRLANIMEAAEQTAASARRR